MFLRKLAPQKTTSETIKQGEREQDETSQITESSGSESSSSECISSDEQEQTSSNQTVNNRNVKCKLNRPFVKSTYEVGIIEAPEYATNMSKEDDHDFEKSIYNRLFHWGPLIALSIIFYISIQSVWLHVMWWPTDTMGGFLNLSLFLFFVYQTIVNHYLASFIGGGYVPKNWIPDEEHCKRLQFCTTCNGYKPPRAHHCSKCGRCVMKMDHHCPWVNNCVGHRNHAFFIRFLAAAIFGCCHALVIIGASLYHAINFGWYLKYGDGSEPVVEITLYSFLVSVGAFTFAAGVAVALSVLLVIQLKYVKNNKNGIEEYIEQKAHYRMQDEKYETALFTYPFDLGWKRNVKEVLCSWSGKTAGNGIWWPVRKDCTQYSLSEEQLRQKKLKNEHARSVVVLQDFKGGCCNALSIGCSTFFCQPLSDEPRVKIEKGEEWVITRGNKRWLYGYKQGSDKTMKGWIPRSLTQLKKVKNHTCDK